MVRVLGVLVGNAVVQTDPLVPVVVRSHAVVQHVSPLLYQLRQLPGSPLVLRVLLAVSYV